MMCQHCAKWKACRPRQLCTRCYSDLGIRKLYPVTSKFCPHHNEYDPSEKELDEMIAEGLRDKPDWWDREPAEPEYSTNGPEFPPCLIRSWARGSRRMHGKRRPL